MNVQRDFTYPDGRLAARERVIYAGDTLVQMNLNTVRTHIRRGKARLAELLDESVLE